MLTKVTTAVVKISLYRHPPPAAQLLKMVESNFAANKLRNEGYKDLFFVMYLLKPTNQPTSLKS